MKNHVFYPDTVDLGAVSLRLRGDTGSLADQLNFYVGF